MKGNASYLMKFLDGAQKRFTIPVYQRNYDWKKDNCKQLFDDLVNLIKDGKESHFFGSIVSYAHGRDEVVLIDGQQRITTVSLIIIAMINALKNGAIKTEDPTLVFRLEDYIIDKYNKQDRKVRLKPFRDDCTAFDKLIYAEEKEYITESKVTINYRYFYDRIVTLKELSADDLFNAIQCLEIIDIELEPQHGDNPQLIFESLNSTGLDLTESDKIRNFVLMNLAPERQEKYYDSYWNKIEKCSKDDLDGFVRNYLTIKQGVIPSLKTIYPSFKDYTKGFRDIEEVLKDMLVYALAYRDITSFNVGNEKANEVAKRLDLLDMTVAYPFFMAFLVYAKDTSLEGEEIYNVFSCIESFIFRRLMCDLPTNALNKIFATLHSSVMKQKKETDTYSSVMIYILESKKLSSAFPKDEEFLNGFATKNIYAMRGKNKQYIFERLENGSSKEKNDVVKNIEDGILTIEHIMPQTLSSAWKQALGDNWEDIQNKWLHTISNLTLSGYNYNYSNKSFQEKKTMENGFLQSGLRLNHYIAQFDNWGETELEKRKNKLSEMALNIWAYPSTSFVPVQKEDDVVFLSEDNSICVGRKIQYFVFREERQPVKEWSEMMWEVINLLYNINPGILYQEAANKENPWFKPTQESKAYKKLADGLYFCPSNNGTWNKMAILKNLFRLYQIDEDDLSFGLLTDKEEGRENDNRHERFIKMWTEFIDYSKKNRGIFADSNPYQRDGMGKSLNVPGDININVIVGLNSARTEIYIQNKDKELNKRVFDYAKRHQDIIQSAIDGTLVWERLDDKKACRIKVEAPFKYMEMADKTPLFEFFLKSSNEMYDAFHNVLKDFKD